MNFTIEYRDAPHSSGLCIFLDGEPYLNIYPGGTGACWNIREADVDDDEGAPYQHYCDLDELIGALKFLRDSEVNRAHLRRWGRA